MSRLRVKASKRPGYIAYDSNGIVWGSGPTVEAAIEDAKGFIEDYAKLNSKGLSSDLPKGAFNKAECLASLQTLAVSAKDYDDFDGPDTLVINKKLVQLSGLRSYRILKLKDLPAAAKPLLKEVGKIYRLPNNTLVIEE